MAEELINVFKNQILLSLGNKSYTFEIVFPTYHRHTITEPIFNSDNLLQILKERLNPSVINGIYTDEETLGKLQEIYPLLNL